MRVRGQTCSRQRCKRPPRVAGLCKTHATEEADRLFSLIIRSRGACENCGSVVGLQCAHGFSRRYRNTRWDARQCYALCSGCHVMFTHDPIRWDLWMRERLGENLYLIIQATALQTTAPDLEPILAELRVTERELRAA